MLFLGEQVTAFIMLSDTLYISELQEVLNEPPISIESEAKKYLFGRSFNTS